MRIALAHLSDIHFRTKSNPIAGRVDQIVSGIESCDPSASLFIVIISGDIAFSGSGKEYAQALDFFGEIKANLEARRPDAAIHYFCVPGNHDCVLPESDQNLRDVLINGILTTLREPVPDAAMLNQVLGVQDPYKDFAKKLTLDGSWDGVCQTMLVEHRAKKIQLNLYNTAMLSRRKERQGELLLPTALFRSKIALSKEASLCISVFHHSYLWLDANVATDFRNHIEGTCDVALSGHQHYAHSFYKQNSTGEQVLYVEAGALQDRDYPQQSAFRVLLFDLGSRNKKPLSLGGKNAKTRTVRSKGASGINLR